MKKGKVFSKGQAVIVLMVVALGAAVWLNMKFTSNEKYLGQAKLVNGTSSKKVTETSAKVAETDYFAQGKSDRKAALEKAQKQVAEMLDSDKLTDTDREQAAKITGEIANRIEKENNIETLLKAKGFEQALAVIGENGINVVVKSQGLTTAQTLQIQDIITSQSNISLGNIKIITVK
ncbi:MAG: SpoIIIAH-like family protein [Clostridia bacterium]|nr:SpoIIIAH-like family protein [Clostridia bacterium]